MRSERRTPTSVRNASRIAKAQCSALGASSAEISEGVPNSWGIEQSRQCTAAAPTSGHDVKTANGIESTSPAKKGKNQGMAAGAVDARKPSTKNPNKVAGQRPRAASVHGTR